MRHGRAISAMGLFVGLAGGCDNTVAGADASAALDGGNMEDLYGKTPDGGAPYWFQPRVCAQISDGGYVDLQPTGDMLCRIDVNVQSAPYGALGLDVSQIGSIAAGSNELHLEPGGGAMWKPGAGIGIMTISPAWA